MAKLAVIMYRCDGCKTTGDPETKDPRYPRSSGRVTRDLLPADWFVLKTVDNMGDGATMHFCPDCMIELSRLLSGMALDSKAVEELGVKPLIDIEPKKEEE
jgi:hypothetical protein